MPLKIGRLTLTEKKYIAKYAASQTLNDIADKLNRDPKSIKKLFSEKAAEAAPPDIKEATPPNPLRPTSVWKRLREEFEPEELAYFEERYLALLKQFQDDVWATEDNQIMKAIKFEILMSRNLIERKKLRRSIAQLIVVQAKFQARFSKGVEMTDLDRLHADNTSNILGNLRAAEQSKYNEYTTLDKQHQVLMKDLKATREQRFSRIEGGKKTFIDFIKQFSDDDVKEREGRQLMQMRKATEKELIRLTSVHTYQDGAQDTPILNADSVSGEAEDKPGEAKSTNSKE